MACLDAVFGELSTFTLANFTFPIKLCASSSRTGSSLRQWPHQSAVKSTSTEPAKARHLPLEGGIGDLDGPVRIEARKIEGLLALPARGPVLPPAFRNAVPCSTLRTDDYNGLIFHNRSASIRLCHRECIHRPPPSQALKIKRAKERAIPRCFRGMALLRRGAKAFS